MPDFYDSEKVDALLEERGEAIRAVEELSHTLVDAEATARATADSEIREHIALKQNTLTAGEGIVIDEDNTISATSQGLTVIYKESAQ